MSEKKEDKRPSIIEHALRIVEARTKAELDVLRSSVFLSFRKEVKVLVLLCNEVEYRLTHPTLLEGSVGGGSKAYSNFTTPSDSYLHCPTVERTERVNTGTRAGLVK